MRLLALFSYGGSYYVLSVTRHLDFSNFFGVSSAISDDDAFLLLITALKRIAFSLFLAYLIIY